jgi:succinoglycan biosynthesis transport protein ExoP
VVSLLGSRQAYFVFCISGGCLTQSRSPFSRPDLDLAAFRTALWEQRVTALVFFVAVVLVALVVSMLSARTYQAVALIQLMPRAGREVAVEEVVHNDAAGYMEGRERARTQIQIILSRSVLEQVLQRYVELGYDDYDPTPQGAVALSRAMVVQPRENTQLVEIGVTHRDPDAAAILANLVAEVYASFNLDVRTDAARESAGWIDTRLVEARAELEAASIAAMDFQQKHDLVDIDEVVNGITTRMDSLQVALGDATTERVMLQSELNNHLRLMRRGEFLVLAGMFPGDPALDTMSRKRAATVMESAEVLARYGDQHPEHQRAVERMARIDALLEQAVQLNIEGLRSQVNTLTRQEEQIAEELQAVKLELFERQRLQRLYRELKLTEERARDLCDSLENRAGEVELQAHSELNDVRVVDQAVAPTQPSSPNLPLNLAVAMFVGLLGGVALAVARHRLGPWRAVLEAMVPAGEPSGQAPPEAPSSSPGAPGVANER